MPAHAACQVHCLGHQGYTNPWFLSTEAYQGGNIHTVLLAVK